MTQQHPKYHSARKSTTERELPLQCWSDIVDVQYCSSLGFQSVIRPHYCSGTSSPPEKWIIMPQLYGNGSHGSGSKSWATRRIKEQNEGVIPTWKEGAPTYPIGSFGHSLLAGAKEMQVIAWLLIEHKFKFGVCAIGSIKIFDSGAKNEKGEVVLEMLIYVQRKTQWLQKAKRDNQIWEADQTSSVQARRCRDCHFDDVLVAIGYRPEQLRLELTWHLAQTRECILQHREWPLRRPSFDSHGRPCGIEAVRG